MTPEKFEDAAHRAYQDERALIRYCKANANALGIDSNKIFLFGISSGGFLVLHQLYLNDAAVDADRITRLGSLDFQSTVYMFSADLIMDLILLLIPKAATRKPFNMSLINLLISLKKLLKARIFMAHISPATQ